MDQEQEAAYHPVSTWTDFIECSYSDFNLLIGGYTKVHLRGT
jgi:hypothetical protein